MNHNVNEQSLIELITALFNELRRQSPEEYDTFIGSLSEVYNPIPHEPKNMLEWRGTAKSLHTLWTFNELHRWWIAENEVHFKHHFTSKHLPHDPLIIGNKINDAIHLLIGLHKRRLISFYDSLQQIIAAHCVGSNEQRLDPQGSLKSAIHKKPVIQSAKRAAFLDQILDTILKDNT